MNTAKFTDSMLMTMRFMAAESVQIIGAAKPVKPSRTEVTEGRNEFRDMVNQKTQGQAKGKGDATQKAPAEQDDMAALTNQAQQELAAAMVMQQMVVVDAEITPEQTAVIAPVVTDVPQQIQSADLPMANAELGSELPVPEMTDETQVATAAPEVAEAMPEGELVDASKAGTATVQNGHNLKTEQPQDRIETEREVQTGPTEREDWKVLEVANGEEAQQVPMFHRVEQHMVKVGEADVVDTTAPDMEAQLADKLNTALDAGAQKIVLQLTPESLGAVVVEMTRSGDGALQVVLHATTDKAANLLTEHASGLGLLLQNNGQNNVQVEVQRQQENYQHQGQEQGRQDGQQQQDGRQQRSHHAREEDFLQQLRLGMVSADGLAG